MAGSADSLHGHLGGGSWPSYLLLTSERLLWCLTSKPDWIASLDLANVRSYSDGTQQHRYVMALEHGSIERTMPNRKRGNLHPVESVTTEETLLVFSRKDTKLAVALRDQLAHHGVTPGAPLVLDEVKKRASGSGVLRTSRVRRLSSIRSRFRRRWL